MPTDTSLWRKNNTNMIWSYCNENKILWLLKFPNNEKFTFNGAMKVNVVCQILLYIPFNNL